jgi:hypothetical protein
MDRWTTIRGTAHHDATAWPPELQDTFSNFQIGCGPVNPEDATFFGNNTPAMMNYFGTDLGLTKVPFPSCPVFQFYRE